jgi:hypothetical protein
MPSKIKQTTSLGRTLTIAATASICILTMTACHKSNTVENAPRPKKIRQQPPPGKLHHYYFTVYALDSSDFPDGLDGNGLWKWPNEGHAGAYSWQWQTNGNLPTLTESYLSDSFQLRLRPSSKKETV